MTYHVDHGEKYQKWDSVNIFLLPDSIKIWKKNHHMEDVKNIDFALKFDLKFLFFWILREIDKKKLLNWYQVKKRFCLFIDFFCQFVDNFDIIVTSNQYS